MARRRPVTAEQRALYSRIGAHESWARTADRTARTKAARDAAFARFEREVDPDGVLDPAERTRRAEHARQAHMLRMTARSLEARARRREC
ncbi:MAG TPA: hypothetical protein VM262_19105 [Acidimicrobiales bacterium]|nr:hypothetical protein [Acidimicrobiales bacterium]